MENLDFYLPDQLVEQRVLFESLFKKQKDCYKFTNGSAKNKLRGGRTLFEGYLDGDLMAMVQGYINFVVDNAWTEDWELTLDKAKNKAVGDDLYPLYEYIKSCFDDLIIEIEDIDECSDFVSNAKSSRELISRVYAVILKHSSVIKIAEKTGLNRESLYKLLKNQNEPKLKSVELILNALEMELSVAKK